MSARRRSGLGPAFPGRQSESRAENSRHDLPLETGAGYEQGGGQGHSAGHPGAALVIDQQALVALKATEGLLDLPPPWLDREARLVLAADQLDLDAVALQRGRGALAGEGEVGPDLAQGARGEFGLDHGRGVTVLDRGGHDAQRLDEALGVGQQHPLACRPLTFLWASYPR